jgi:hypothetical protein
MEERRVKMRPPANRVAIVAIVPKASVASEKASDVEKECASLFSSLTRARKCEPRMRKQSEEAARLVPLETTGPNADPRDFGTASQSAMHPPLTLENHPLCREVVIALKVCHRENPWSRSFGACNEQKWALDECLKKQKLFKFRENNKKATAEKERLRARVEKYGHSTVNGKFTG